MIHLRRNNRCRSEILNNIWMIILDERLLLSRASCLQPSLRTHSIISCWGQPCCGYIFLWEVMQAKSRITHSALTCCSPLWAQRRLGNGRNQGHRLGGSCLPSALPATWLWQAACCEFKYLYIQHLVYAARAFVSMKSLLSASWSACRNSFPLCQ